MIFLRASAIFIADAHFLPADARFWRLHSVLRALDERSEVVFLGDTFAALFGGVKSSANAYAAEICALDNLRARVIIFEGNHDFALARLFKRARVVAGFGPHRAKLVHPRAMSAILCANFCNDKFRARDFRKCEFFAAYREAFIQHGDVFLPPLTQFALAFLRRPSFLAAANLLDFRGWIFARILGAQRRKRLYKRLKNFAQITSQRLSALRAREGEIVNKLIIEGHFHQGRAWRCEGAKYVNLPNFCGELVQSFYPINHAATAAANPPANAAKNTPAEAAKNRSQNRALLRDFRLRSQRLGVYTLLQN